MTESSTLSEYGKVYTDLPEVVPNCQVSLRGCGLPHQCAHWFAMTCRRQRRVSECKDVGCSDMLKAVACQRVQGRVWRVSAQNLAAHLRVQERLAPGRLPHCHCKEQSDVAIRNPCGTAAIRAGYGCT